VRAWRERIGMDDPSTDLGPLRRQYNAMPYELRIYPERGPGDASPASILERVVIAAVALIAVVWWIA
jgi:hypothetical protein